MRSIGPTTGLAADLAKRLEETGMKPNARPLGDKQPWCASPKPHRH